MVMDARYTAPQSSHTPQSCPVSSVQEDDVLEKAVVWPGSCHHHSELRPVLPLSL